MLWNRKFENGIVEFWLSSNPYRDTNQNLGTQLARIINRAGMTPWPKLFHNLWATRPTELTERLPKQVVCARLGNTPEVADDHYLQVTEDHYETAAQIPAQSAAERVCQRETAFPAERRKVTGANDLHLSSIHIKTYDYPQGDSKQTTHLLCHQRI